MRLWTILAATTFFASIPQANAQNETGRPAFRVPIGGEASRSSGTPTFAWMENISTCSNTCGDGTRTRSYQCQDVASYDFSGAGYGAPEPEASCTTAKPAAFSVSCTNYSGCSYDWVKPAVSTTILPKPGNPEGGNFPSGAVANCSYAKRVYAPTCQRDGNPSVTMPKGDHAFCKNDTPDYDDVKSGNVDALGYDRETDDSSGCVVGARDHAWKFSRVVSEGSTCSAAPVRRNEFQCVEKYNGKSKANSFCAGATVPAPGINETRPADFTGCTKVWESSAWGPYGSTCSENTTRTRTVLCRRSDGTAVADLECAGAKPATSEGGQNLVGCGYEWTTPTAWVYGSKCSDSTTRNRTTSCRRTDGVIVTDDKCSAVPKPSTSEAGVVNHEACTYLPRDMGKTECANSQYQQYWDCTRSDGQTGYPATYCGKTNPETKTCTMPPPVYTYTPVNRGESPCSGNQKNLYWDCTRNDGTTGFPASNCGKTNPEVVGCTMPVTYTPRNRGESACSAGQKQVYWDCLGSDGSVAPASSCGKANPETQSCPMTYSWQWITGAYGSPSGGCPGSTTRTRAVQCQRNDGYIDSDQYCNAGTRPSSTDVQACPYTWSWGTGGWSGYSSGCSASSTRTRSVYCQRNDGYVDSDQFCSAGARPASSETASVYSSCTYATEVTGTTACSGGYVTETLQCRRSDSVVVANSQCGVGATRQKPCANPETIGYACVGGTRVYHMESSQSGGYADPYGGKGPGNNSVAGNPNDPRINCTETTQTDWSEYGVYEYRTLEWSYYINSTGTTGEPFYNGDNYGSSQRQAHYNGR